MAPKTRKTVTRRMLSVRVERMFFALVRRRTSWLTLFCFLLAAIYFFSHYRHRQVGDSAGGFSERGQPKSDGYRILTITGRSYESKMSRIKVYRCNSSAAVTKPEVSRIRWNNRDWQSPEGTGLFLYSAFYDTRIRDVYSERHCFVRILAMRDSLETEVRQQQYFCQIWLLRHDDRGPLSSWPVVTDAEFTEIWSAQWDSQSQSRHYKPYIVSCAIPRKLNGRIRLISHGVMMHVSITTKPCENASSLLPVWYSGAPPSSSHPNTAPNTSVRQTQLPPRVQQRAKTSGFVVCVKPLDFDRDFSERFVEWIEMNLILGASRIDVYKFKVHPNVDNVLVHYNATGRVRVIPMTLPGNQPNYPVERSQFLKRNLWQKRRDELIPYNDCLYRNMYEFDYIVPLDVDELLIPRAHHTWQQMFGQLADTDENLLNSYASFSVRNAYFLESFADAEAPSTDADAPVRGKNNDTVGGDLYVLTNVYRSANFSSSSKSVKSFVRTDKTLSVFNHYALETVLPGIGRSTVLPVEVVQMNHYRSRCPATMSKDCQENFLKFKVKDVITWKYEEQLRANVRNSLLAISSLKSH